MTKARYSKSALPSSTERLDQWLREWCVVSARCPSNPHLLYRHFVADVNSPPEFTEDAFTAHLATLGFPLNEHRMIPALVLSTDFFAALEIERIKPCHKHQSSQSTDDNLPTKENTMSPIMITYTPKQYELPDEGPHAAVVADVIDLGERETEYGPKDQIRLIFLVDQLDSQGNPIELRRTYNKTAHEKASVRKVAKMLLGRDPGRRFDAESLIGLNTGLIVVYEESEECTRANIDSFYKLRQGDTLVPIPHGYKRYQDRKPVDVSARIKAESQAVKKNGASAKRKASPASANNHGADAKNADQPPEDEQK